MKARKATTSFTPWWTSIKAYSEQREKGGKEAKEGEGGNSHSSNFKEMLIFPKVSKIQPFLMRSEQWWQMAL